MNNINAPQIKTEEKINGRNTTADENVNTEIMSINQEQQKVIEKLEEILNFLKLVQIKNEESFVSIKKPLDDLLSSLKYLPVEPSFNILPTEVKTKILSYTCDNGAFVAASVCDEWKQILLLRLTSFKEVKIGKHCSNNPNCEGYECFKPVSMLNASITLQLDIPLTFCHPVANVDSQLITEAVTSASDITISEECCCCGYGSIMTAEQLTHLFTDIENQDKMMDSVELIEVDFYKIGHDRLLNCLLYKTKKATLKGDFQYLMGVEQLLNVEKLSTKLLYGSTESKIEHLVLDIGYSEYFSDQFTYWDLADALCKIETIELLPKFSHDGDWRTLINLQDMTNVFDKMEALTLRGLFTLEQLEVARVVPGVQTTLFNVQHNSWEISKGSREH